MNAGDGGDGGGDKGGGDMMGGGARLGGVSDTGLGGLFGAANRTNARTSVNVLLQASYYVGDSANV